MDARTLVIINSVVQVALLVTLAWAGYLAKQKRLKRHCLVMRVAGGVQIAATLGVMLPALLGYQGVPDSYFSAEIIVHHTIGVLVLLTWIFVNLAQAKVIRFHHRLRVFMRAATVGWVIVFAMGAHMYYRLWL